MATLSAEPLSKSYATVNGRQMAYHDSGSGDPVVVPCTATRRLRTCGATSCPMCGRTLGSWCLT